MYWIFVFMDEVLNILRKEEEVEEKEREGRRRVGRRKKIRKQKINI